MMTERDLFADEPERENLLETALLARRTRVLVAEHVGALRSSIVDSLRDDGHEVTEAFDGADLVAQIGRPARKDVSCDPPDVVICDAELPGLREADLFRAAVVPETAQVILIVSAGVPSPEEIRLRMHASAVCPCPPDLDDLRNAVLKGCRMIGG